MSALTRIDLERLLQDRKLARPGLLPEADERAEGDERFVAATGLATLDARLGGGWPRGQVSEVVGPASTGATWAACLSLAAATRRGELAALVDPLDVFDPETAAGAGFVWPYFLWARGRSLDPAAESRAPANDRRGKGSVAGHQAIERALKALALILQSEGFGCVLLDLLGFPPALTGRLPFTTWRRVQRLIEGRGVACVVLARHRLARSAGGVTLALDRPEEGSACWAGSSARRRRLAGLAAQGHVEGMRWQAATLETFTVYTTER